MNHFFLRMAMSKAIRVLTFSISLMFFILNLFSNSIFLQVSLFFLAIFIVFTSITAFQEKKLKKSSFIISIILSSYLILQSISLAAFLLIS